jgi:hypothetical protein
MLLSALLETQLEISRSNVRSTSRMRSLIVAVSLFIGRQNNTP